MNKHKHINSISITILLNISCSLAFGQIPQGEIKTGPLAQTKESVAALVSEAQVAFPSQLTKTLTKNCMLSERLKLRLR